MLSVRRAWGVMAHSPVRGRAKIDCNSHLRFHLEGYQQRDWNMALRRDDIAVRTILEGRPQQIPHTVRASFSHGRVVGGRVQVSRKGSSRYSDDLAFEPVSPGERLMADESLSKLRSRMSPAEIDGVRAIHDALYAAATRYTPLVDFPATSGLRVNVEIEDYGAARILSALRSIVAVELVQSILVRIAYLMGQPPKPGQRWLSAIRGLDADKAMSELPYIEAHISLDAKDQLISIINEATAVMGRKADGRVAHVCQLAGDTSERELVLRFKRWMEGRPLRTALSNDLIYARVIKELEPRAAT